jgi:hypothetical protein
MVQPACAELRYAIIAIQPLLSANCSLSACVMVPNEAAKPGVADPVAISGV